MRFFNVKVWDAEGVDQIRQVGANEAINLLRSGTGELEQEQAHAPLELAKAFPLDRITPEMLGPETTYSTLLAKVSDHVFANGVRQRLAKGHPLHWHDGYEDLLEAVEIEFSDCSKRPSNLFNQLRRAMIWRAETEGRLVYFNHHPSNETLRTKGLVPSHIDLGKRKGLFVTTDDGGSYSDVGLEWRAYYDWLSDAWGRIRDTLDAALAEGRILCGEASPQGHTFIPPSIVGEFKENRSAKNRAYFFSKNLPSEWFTELTNLPSRKKAAIAWIERAGTRFADEGRRPSKGDLLSVAGSKFDLTSNALADIWPVCEFPNKGKIGAIPKIERVSVNDINKI